MALGNTQINQIEYIQTNVKKNLEIIKDCWNTFQFISNNLENWAEETTIGNNTREDLKREAATLKANIDGTEDLQKDLTVLIETQRAINNGKREE